MHLFPPIAALGLSAHWYCRIIKNDISFIHVILQKFLQATSAAPYRASIEI